MTHPNDPDLTVTIEDFRASGWGQALAGEDEDFGYPTLSSSLFAAATNATEQGRREHAKVLWLLGAATSMMLHPQSYNEPFRPYAVFGDRRSAIPDDFTADDLALFSQIVDEIDHDLLKARLADLLWLMLHPRQYLHAVSAIDSYTSIPLSSEEWYRGGSECWARALSLALKLGNGAGTRVFDMHSRITARILQATRDDKFFTVQLASLARENQPVKEEAPKVAEKMEALAIDFDQQRDSYSARAYYEEAKEWYARLRIDEKVAEMTVRQAETLVSEAESRKSGEATSQMLANSLYEKAIQVYREIPARQRSLHRVDERIAELRVMQSESGAKVLGEMGVLSTPGIDITDAVEHARQSVSGKQPVDALFELANIYHGERVKTLRARVIENMRKFPLQTLFEATHYADDGRVVAKTPGSQSPFAEAADGEDPAVYAGMIRDYSMFLGLTVKSAIWPALEVVQLEHRITEADFVDLAKACPIVPHGREILFGKGLHAGYQGDFATSLHLLIPQIEHMVRLHLKAAGAMTTTLDADGIENEIGLSALMKLPQVDRILDEDLAFQFRALFCDARGPNLRNELAHGLIGPKEFSSAAAIYAWWFTLRLVFNSWWRLANEPDSSDPQVDEATT